MAANVLADILAAKRTELARSRRDRPSRAALAAAAAAAPSPRDFPAALRAAAPGVAVIAELKRRSPSLGELAREVTAAGQARRYQAGGAAALSVLCDRAYFGGSLADLAAARAACALPVLCKDFILEEEQLLAARATGADGVLLIAAALEPARLRDLHQAALALGLAPLVEVHAAEELEAVLAVGPLMVGINNRDLRTLRVDLGRCLALRPLVPDPILTVAESGIGGPADLARLRAGGFGAFLVGSALMRAPDPTQALRGLVAAGEAA